ncbi:bifunctional 3'-5' exonuclease/DNA polymerase [uncultured Caudovirales phage]|uniref:Bifunctional 3'-5' exonuclease/DNA polymerase n=1 Tax=uncultured Caudovirales phage TaxID=2100421 RepID=A0A6J5REC6_9CAUD|nr:bifunctional 3'-5' exonuclease/DNA polymerase [uncultured Caudovirales phage]CAB4195399.1 bifunctional 3'-5' exonuclease/DNA polymerase [uncultured Caudovirales phage]CAB4204914.1 bifunctional 3'-5' exonuclease/DNA polymerase [uncultured Caudovirales phage]
MNVIVFDTETFYSKEYSLSKLTQEAYIRSTEFEVIGVSVKVDGGPTEWFSGTHEETKAFLDRFPFESSAVVAHNAAFDVAILGWHFGIKPKRIVDTLSMARALGQPSVSLANLVKVYGLGEKGTEVVAALGKRRADFTEEELAAYGAYCCNDTELTYALFNVLVSGFPLEELKLIDLTIRMFTEPKLELDAQELVDYLGDVEHAKLAWLSAVKCEREDLMSNPRFAQELRNMGVEPPMKISPTTGKETYAFSKTDEAFMALLEHEHLGVQTLMAARLGTKSTIEETRTKRLIDIAARGTLPVPLTYYGAHTGRWSGAGGSVNMQNLPRNGVIKKSIKAPKGQVLLGGDSSQIEARTLAWLAEQDDLVEAFDRGEDVYKQMASKIYNKAEKDIDKIERFVGKTVILGCGYGTGWAKLQATLKTSKPSVTMTEDEARDTISTYRSSYSKIPELWESAKGVFAAIIGDQSYSFGRNGLLQVDGQEGIRLPNRMFLRYPNLRNQRNEETGKQEYVYDTKKGRSTITTRIYASKVIENVCQALARIIIGEQMLRINRKYPVVMTVHDSIVALVPEGEAELAKEYMEMAMRIRPDWALELPLNCEVGYGPTYYDCK